MSRKRSLFKRRALEEIGKSIIAASREASVSHAALARLHIDRCGTCVTGQTTECSDCALAPYCRSKFARDRTLHRARDYTSKGAYVA